MSGTAGAVPLPSSTFSRSSRRQQSPSQERAYLDATTLDDFAGESDEPVVGTIESASDGEVELMFELSDETPVAFATIPELPEDEQITIKLDKGDLIED